MELIKVKYDRINNQLTAIETYDNGIVKKVHINAFSEYLLSKGEYEGKFNDV